MMGLWHRLNARRQRSEGRERGIALLTSIWLIMAVAAISLSGARENAVFVQTAANEVDAAKARALAEAGVVRMALQLAADARGIAIPTAPSRGTPVDSTDRGAEPGRATLAWTYDATNVALSAEAERGKLDLNTADAALIRALMVSLRIPEPGRIVDGILSARAPGAATEAAPWRVDPAPFDTVGDLGRVPSVSPDIVRRLAPFVTTHSGRRTPDPVVAPEAVFATLPLSDERREEAQAARRAPVALASRRTETYRLTARVVTANGLVVRETALVEIAPGSTAPIRIMD